MLLELPPNALIVRPLDPSPVKTQPGKIRVKPDLLGMPTIIWSSGEDVPPNSIVRLTADALVLVAYNHTSSITPLLA